MIYSANLDSTPVPAKSALLSYKIGRTLLCPYRILIEYFCRYFQRTGQFINERPFLTGTIIRAPLRLEFVIKNALRGDFINVAVGVFWIVGDLALAMNDESFRRWVVRPYFNFPFKRNT